MDWHTSQAWPQSWCHIDVSFHKEPPDEDCSRNTMRSNPIDSSQIDTEWLALQMHKCTQNSQKLLGLQRWTLHWGWSTHERWTRFIIPPSCRDSIMDDLHKSHAGINKALALARMCVYWPEMEADVTDYIKRCLTCIESSNLPVETLHPHEVPPGPWVKLGMDFFQDHQGKNI